ncbi:methyl-accepting chemotaxis protein [Marinobacter sp. C2H3]|uniref:methyl-accepting chemotaxis protein n=1 Tax=Marinobacter sp. C2H3 TaxID=3119003 RepID=UPI00300E73A7
MTLFHRFGLRTKIALPFAITAAALILVGVLSAMSVRTLLTATDRVASTYLPAVSTVLNGDRDLYQALTAQMGLLDAAFNGGDTTPFIATFDENAKQALDRFKKAEALLTSLGPTDLGNGFDQAYNDWLNAARRAMTMATNGDPGSARALATTEAAPRFDRLREYYDKLGALADERAGARAEASSRTGMTNLITTAVVTVIALVVSLAVFFLFLKLILGSIRAIRDQLDAMAQGEGDLTQRVPVTVQDDLGQLAESFNRVLANLQEMIRSIQTLSGDLAERADGLAHAARANSDGIARQTESIDMVATAINEMQSAIEEVAGNANRAAEITRDTERTGADNARLIGDSSRQVQRLAAQIAKAIDAITTLSRDSDNITSVLDVIRGIAEQTNLLALNAAIEAARAGEQGRGFAVVADEVRSLAGRTQQSTEDIHTMITALQAGVAAVVTEMEAGQKEAAATERLASEAEHGLQSILQGISTISDMNTSVASATEEQTQVVEEINRNVTDINDLASESDTRSREIDQISQSLNEYAADLGRQASRFRV